MSKGDGPPDSDTATGAPHPRETPVLFGHAAIEADLLEAYRRGKLPHAILIGGPEGIGKATLAWRLARFVLAHPDPASPEVRAAVDLSVPPAHPVARRIAAMSHGDIFRLRREWNDKPKPPRHFTEIRVDDVRKAISMFQMAASEGGWRVCIVDTAEDLNANAANALLKIIEEPPPRSLFLVIAHRPGQVLATIRSRCRKLLLPGLAPADIVRAIRAIPGAAPEGDVATAAARAEGSVREAMRLLAGGALALDGGIDRQLSALPRVNWRDVHALADSVTGRDQERSFDTFLHAVFGWLSRAVREGAASGAGAARLGPLGEVYEVLHEKTREAEALNLDKRALVLSIFSELSAAVALSLKGEY